MVKKKLYTKTYFPQMTIIYYKDIFFFILSIQNDHCWIEKFMYTILCVFGDFYDTINRNVSSKLEQRECFLFRRI
jgi:hypothetical protein